MSGGFRADGAKGTMRQQQSIIEMQKPLRLSQAARANINLMAGRVQQFGAHPKKDPQILPKPAGRVAAGAGGALGAPQRQMRQAVYVKKELAAPKTHYGNPSIEAQKRRWEEAGTSPSSSSFNPTLHPPRDVMEKREAAGSHPKRPKHMGHDLPQCVLTDERGVHAEAPNASDSSASTDAGFYPTPPVSPEDAASASAREIAAAAAISTAPAAAADSSEPPASSSAAPAAAASSSATASASSPPSTAAPPGSKVPSGANGASASSAHQDQQMAALRRNHDTPSPIAPTRAAVIRAMHEGKLSEDVLSSLASLTMADVKSLLKGLDVSKLAYAVDHTTPPTELRTLIAYTNFATTLNSHRQDMMEQAKLDSGLGGAMSMKFVKALNPQFFVSLNEGIRVDCAYILEFTFTSCPRLDQKAFLTAFLKRCLRQLLLPSQRRNAFVDHNHKKDQGGFVLPDYLIEDLRTISRQAFNVHVLPSEVHDKNRAVRRLKHDTIYRKMLAKALESVRNEKIKGMEWLANCTYGPSNELLQEEMDDLHQSEDVPEGVGLQGDDDDDEISYLSLAGEEIVEHAMEEN